VRDAKKLHKSSPSFLVVDLLWNQCCVPAWGNDDFHFNEALGLRLVLRFSSATLVCRNDESQICQTWQTDHRTSVAL
jgi:hypothetical protein